MRSFDLVTMVSPANETWVGLSRLSEKRGSVNLYRVSGICVPTLSGDKAPSYEVRSDWGPSAESYFGTRTSKGAANLPIVTRLSAAELLFDILLFLCALPLLGAWFVVTWRYALSEEFV